MYRFTFLAGLLTILSFTLAQTYYPACSIPCIYDTTAIAQAGCLSTDGYCLCQSQSFLKEVSCCVRSNCDASDEKAAFAEAVYVCSTWGVTLSTGGSVSCSATTTTSNPTQATNTATVASSTIVPLTNTNPKYRPKKGLSAGAKGGIGAGVGVVVLALGALAGFLLKRRNDKKKAAAAVPATAAAQIAAAPSAPAGYLEKNDTTITVNQAPPPQYPQTPQGQYVQPQSQGQYPQGQYPQQSPQQYQPPPFQPYAPQPSQTPQPQYAPQPSQTPLPQYAPQPPQTPQSQYQYPAQQNQAPVYNVGPELQGSPVVQNQPQQGWNSTELPAPGTVQPRHEAP